MASSSRTLLGAAVAALLVLGAVPTVATAARRPAHVTVVLAPRDPAALTAYARAVSDPASTLYRRYLTPSQFAARFGASAATVTRVRRQLNAGGLIPGALSANHLSIRAVPAADVARRSLAELGRQAASSVPGVQAIEGLTPAAGPHPLLVRAPARHQAQARRAHIATGGPQPCAAARSAAAAAGAYTADQIASAYGMSDIYRSGNVGTGVTVAVYELEPVAASDLAAFQSCYATNASISYVRVDGGAGTGQGSGEAALDIENVLGYAPGAQLLVYQGPNSNSGAPGSGPYDVFSAIVNQDRAQVISVSWGECEAALGAASAQAENALFEQATVQGQTIVAAGGDSGAQDCQAAGSVPQPAPGVDDPASQPFVTGVGGTTLSSLGPRPTEQVWNNGGTPAALLSPGAGGGGVSGLWAMPSAQLNAASALGVRRGSPNGGTCGRPGAWCREVPDVTGDADPATGYEIYWNGSAADPSQPRGWQAIGGTSGTAPVWASVIALADASASCGGGSVGMALPALYRAAGSDYASAFNDVRSGNNDFTGTNSGQFSAAPGYDEASGLGSPNATALIPDLCANALRLTPLLPQRSARRATIAPLRVGWSDAPRAGAVLQAKGLPSGLRFSPAKARITGTPRRAGVYHVRISAVDRDGAKARQSFTWTIGNPTRLTSVSVSGLSAGRPTLVFTVLAGRRSPALHRLIFRVPSELRLRSTRAITIRSAGRRARFSARLAGGRLTVTLRRNQASARVTLGPRALGTGSGRGAHSGRLTVTSVASDNSTSVVQAGIKRR
ncbi:MAG: hypothetical protein QOF83_3621 [Solirubrobacteraceae bacterium]|jgi:hypothetical protein|nr:hypothetical protein [Solirubrobacteraceae bacterium]